MAIASSIDIVLENDDIVVLGPPTSIDIAVDIGPQGPRGSRTFTGAADPNTYTTSQFETIYGNVPVYGDIFIRTSSGSDYGLFYMYNTLAIGGPIWQEVLRVYDLLTNFFTVNDTFVLSGKNGGTGAANTGKSLLLGGPQTIFNGNNTVTITSTGNTSVTLPTSGTLATTGNLSQFSSTTSSQLAGIISDETGTGSLVFATSPTLAGTPLSTTAAVDTNTTQIATTAFVIGQATSSNPSALGSVAVGTSTRYARSDHVHPTTGLGLTSGTLAQFASTTSSELAGVISDETGSGSLVFATSPSLTTPNIGAATGTSLTTTGSITASTTGGRVSLGIDSGGSITLGRLDNNATSPYIDFNSGSTTVDYDVRLQASGGNGTSGNGILTVIGSLITEASSASHIGFRLPHGTAPTSLTDGDIWTTTSGMYVRVNGSTIGPLGTGGGGGGGTTNTEDVIGISFFTMGA